MTTVADPIRIPAVALAVALALAFLAGAAFDGALHRSDVAHYQRQIETLSQALEDASN